MTIFWTISAATAPFRNETTGDQFFGEEQLEAYRALGFHVMKGLLTGKRRLRPSHAGTKRRAKRGCESSWLSVRLFSGQRWNLLILAMKSTTKKESLKVSDFV